MKPSTRILLMQKRLLTPIFLGSRLASWLDATDSRTIILDGSTASQWRDKSGNRRHASQGVKANQPTYTANGLNGSPVLTFDGTDDFFSVTSFTGSRIISIMIIASTNSTGQNQYLLDESNALNYGGGLSIRFTNTGVIRFWGQDVISLTDSGNIIQGSANIIGGIEGVSVRNVFLNGVSSQTVLPGTSIRDASNPRIGHSALLGGFLNGTIAEILIVNGAISTYEHQQLTGYLAWKWGLTANLPNNHPFKFRPPYM